MTQEEKELLLRDLCARFPYGVKVYGNYRYINGDEIVDDKKIKVLDLSALDWFVNGIDIKPYLRPMSKMTEKEEEEYEEVVRGSFEKQLEFYLRNHLDFRGLIPKGIALEALDGMYNK